MVMITMTMEHHGIACYFSFLLPNIVSIPVLIFDDDKIFVSIHDFVFFDDDK